MPTAICKFRVSSVEDSGNDSQEIKMTTQYDPDDSEDTKFSKYTPWGNLEFELSNPNLVGTFEAGKVYKVMLVPEDEA